MSAKSIIDIDVNDERFKQFVALFDKYKAAVAQLPASWNQQAKPIDNAAKGFGEMTAALLAQYELSRQIGEQQKKNQQVTTGTGRVFDKMAKDTLTVSRNIISATASLLKWAGITGIVSGLVGAGGLFGIDRLAASAGSARRGAQGLGLSTAQQQAFDVNYSRYVDPDSLLSNVAGVIRDPSKQFGVGATAANLARQGVNTADIASQLLPEIRAQFIAFGQNRQLAESSGLTNFVSFEDLIRLAQNKPEDLDASRSGYGRDLGRFAVPDSTNKAWQDLTIRLQEAGQQIKSTFITDLVGLSGPIGRLSESFTTALDAFLRAPEVKHLIDLAADGLDHFAKYVGSPDFKSDVDTFAAGMGRLAKALEWLGGHTGGVAGAAVGATVGGGIAGPIGAGVGAATGGLVGDVWQKARPELLDILGLLSGLPTRRPAAGTSAASAPSGYGSAFANNNALGLRSAAGVPSVGGFAKFGSFDDSIAAGVKQLLLYQNRDHLQSIRDIVTKYEGGPSNPDHNDIAAYIRDVVKQTGYGETQTLNLNDPNVMAKLLAAMSKHEGVKAYDSGQVVKIINQTGGSAVVIGSQVAQ